MISGLYILSQILDRLVERYNAESRIRHFGCRQQLVCMAFAQLTWREDLRDIATCLNEVRPETLYRLGFRDPVAKSTLSDVNDERDWRFWEDLARSLMRKAFPLCAEDRGLELENTVYAPDSTTIDLPLTLFPCADFRRIKAICAVRFPPVKRINFGKPYE